MILGILSFLVVLGSLAALIQKDATTFIQALVIDIFDKSLWTT